MNLSSLQLGDVVGGRWRIDRFIAAGGFGRVYAATDISAADIGQVAVKVLLDQASTAERQGFLDEVRHMAALRHPNLVTHIDSGIIDDNEHQAVYLVTELCDESLDEYRAGRPGSVLTDAEINRLVADVGAGLDHLHRSGRVHRDLKPANILRKGDTWKLTDFGLVRDLSASGVYHLSDSTAGTLRYLAPEFFHDRQVGPSTDIWSLGVVVHEVATGHGVHEGEGVAFVHNLANTPPTISPALAPGLATFVSRCLARDPDRRPPAGAVAAHGIGAMPPAPVGSDDTPGSPAGASPSPVAPAVTGTIDPSIASGIVQQRAQDRGQAAPAPDRRDRRRALLVAGAVAAVIVLAGLAVWLLTRGDGADSDVVADAVTSDGEADSDAEASDSDGDAEADSGGDGDADDLAGPEASSGSDELPAVGSNIHFADIVVGMCGVPNVSNFARGPTTVQSCDSSHQLEVIGLVEHPEAGGDYPGVDGLQRFGLTECGRIFENRFGVSDVETRLSSNPYVPTEDDWDDQAYNIVCAVGRSDIQPLTMPLGEDVSDYVWASGDSISIYEIRSQWCFDTPTPIAPSLGENQRVVFRECSEPHTGESFAAVLHFDLEPEDATGDGATPYDEELVAADAVRKCHDSLHDLYGADHRDFGLVDMAWYPSGPEWDNGSRVSTCVVLFDEPIEQSLDDLTAE